MLTMGREDLDHLGNRGDRADETDEHYDLLEPRPMTPLHRFPFSIRNAAALSFVRDRSAFVDMDRSGKTLVAGWPAMSMVESTSPAISSSSVTVVPGALHAVASPVAVDALADVMRGAPRRESGIRSAIARRTIARATFARAATEVRSPIRRGTLRRVVV